ncbi:MAG: acyl-CoA synthetase [Gordonia sp. (in: high G+C Gram-positive bacteria)]|nr:MAG: acyl-CoA synthetase [Gordonia sp. (in: high G+C Gram-positive bacteria)]
MTDTAAPLFNLSTVFQGIAEAIPDVPLLTWRGRHHTYREVDVRADGIAHYLTSVGMGCQRERSELQNHESGQDHLALYLLNGNEYIEAMIGAYRARVAPFNCSYRYVEAELIHMLTDSRATGIVYHARFAPVLASVRDQLPDLRVLIQVADESGNDLLPGAVDYESIVTTPAPGAQRAGRLDTEPATGMPTPSGEDLYLLYTGGTTGMPKGVMWRQHDIFVSSMGGRPFGSETAYPSIDAIADVARAAAGNIASMLLAPLIHGAAQWALFNIMTMGGRIIMPDTVDTLRPDEVLRLVEAEKVFNLPVVGDAMARPLIDEIERGDYDLSSLSMVSNGGANVSHGVRERFRAAIPGVLILNVLGSSEGGLQMTAAADADDAPTFAPQSDTAVLADDLDRVLAPGEGEGWLGRSGLVPLGYLGDPAKTARTFPTIDGVRWSVPGDRAVVLDEGHIQVLGRSSAMINSGGEKVFAEEVERAVLTHPGVADVVVVGRPSERWGSEVVAIIALVDGADPSDEELDAACREHIAGYKVPKEFIRTSALSRSPAGKIDLRWAKSIAAKTA